MAGREALGRVVEGSVVGGSVVAGSVVAGRAVAGRVVVGTVVVAAGIAILLVGGWLMRPVSIVYRAEAGTCGFRATLSERGGGRHEERHTAPFEREVTLRHGEVANLIVTPEPGCEVRARCAIVENGVTVSEAQGWNGATCSASTGR